MRFFNNLVFPGSLISRGRCKLRTPSLIWLDAVSDSLVALSFLPIIFTQVYQFREPLNSLAVCWPRVDQPCLRQAMAYRMEKLA